MTKWKTVTVNGQDVKVSSRVADAFLRPQREGRVPLVCVDDKMLRDMSDARQTQTELGGVPRGLWIRIATEEQYEGVRI